MDHFPSPPGEDAADVPLDRQHPFLGIHAVSIFVRDQDQSLRFYLDQLGFRLAFDARLQSGDRWVAVALPDGTTVLALVAPRPDSREYRLIGRPTGVIIVTEDVIAKYDEWRRRDVHFLFTPRLRRFRYEHQLRDPLSTAVSVGPEEEPPVWGGVFTQFRDVDGNSFALVGFDQVNRSIEAQRRQVAGKLEAERRAAQELEIAKQVQARLFPQRLPPIATLDYAGACVQAREVGGDYHDFLDLGRGRYGLLIADISGKGIAAALLMANLQANFRSQVATALDGPARLLCSVNKLFYESTSESAYATMFFAEYDDTTGQFCYANCGHLAALLLRRDGTVEKLESTCTVVGLFKEWHCSIAENRLFPGDLLALYSDGITESFSHAGEEFGEQRLIQALSRNRSLSPQAVIASIVDEVRNFSTLEQHDDITLIVAKCRCGAGPTPPESHLPVSA